jgi:hypothetical protein
VTSHVKNDVTPIGDNGIISFRFVHCFLNNSLSYLFVLDRQAFWLLAGAFGSFAFCRSFGSFAFCGSFGLFAFCRSFGSLYLLFVDHFLFVDHLDHLLFVDHLDNLPFKPPAQKSNLRVRATSII